MADSYDISNIKLIPQQLEFLTSEKRFPCFIGGIGVGKTLVLLLKAVRWCQMYPGSVGMVIRREFVDLRDSTVVDFKRYFGTDPDSARNIKFENGSIMMFRHAQEIGHANLKNLSLDFVAFEQMEEMDDDESFKFLRDRMRGKAHPGGLQQIFAIANANGHNWVWRRWVNEPESKEFHLVTATTFDNEHNLPPAFVADMRSRERTEPRHFQRMCMNNFDEELADDNVFRTVDLDKSSKLDFVIPTFTRYVAGLDVGRYGTDSSCLTILVQCGVNKWRQIFIEERRGYSVPQVAGWARDVWKTFPFDTIGVDDIGVGGGVADLLDDSTRFSCCKFVANEKPNGVSPYMNKKAEGYFRLEEMISKEWLQLMDDVELKSELSTIRYFYRQDSIKHIVSKDEMRRQGVKSPNKAEALMIACFYAEHRDVENINFEVVPGGDSRYNDLQKYAVTD